MPVDGGGGKTSKVLSLGPGKSLAKHHPPGERDLRRCGSANVRRAGAGADNPLICQLLLWKTVRVSLPSLPLLVFVDRTSGQLIPGQDTGMRLTRRNVGLAERAAHRLRRIHHAVAGVGHVLERWEYGWR